MTVEFYGQAKRIAKTAKTEIDLPDVPATLRDAAMAVAKRFPELRGSMLSPKTLEPIETYRFNINGKYMAQNLDVEVKEGDKILLMPIAAGG